MPVKSAVISHDGARAHDDGRNCRSSSRQGKRGRKSARAELADEQRELAELAHHVQDAFAQPRDRPIGLRHGGVHDPSPVSALGLFLGRVFHLEIALGFGLDFGIGFTLLASASASKDTSDAGAPSSPPDGRRNVGHHASKMRAASSGSDVCGGDQDPNRRHSRR